MYTKYTLRKKFKNFEIVENDVTVLEIKIHAFWPWSRGHIGFWQWRKMNYLYLLHIYICLTHWGRVTHICVGKLTIIDSDNGLSPGRRQAIIRTNAGILLIGPLGTNFNEILISIQTFSFKKMHLKMSSAKWRAFCFGLNVLISSII